MNRPNARSKHSRRWVWIERGIFLTSTLSPPRTNHDQRLVVEKADKKHGTHLECRAQRPLAWKDFYFPAISKSTFVSSLPFTVTFWLVLPSFCCQTSTV